MSTRFIPLFGALLLFAVLTPERSRSEPKPHSAPNDHAHDFDWEFGSWKADLMRLKHPLSGEKEWLHYTGTTTVRRVWGGTANFLEFDVNGPAGHLQALSLRLYDPETENWSIHYANSASSDVSAPPAVGHFEGNRGTFQDRESYRGHEIMVRLVMTVLTRDCAHFVQSFSGDGGQTWEANWIVTDTRVGSDERTCRNLVGGPQKAKQADSR